MNQSSKSIIQVNQSIKEINQSSKSINQVNQSHGMAWGQSLGTKVTTWAQFG